MVAEVTPISVPGASQAIAYDAVNNLIWVVSQSGATLTGLNPADGSVSRQPISLPQAEYVGLISVGNYLWVAFYPTVMQIEASTGQVVRQVPINNDEPSALVYDHVNNLIWVTDQSKGTLTRIDASTGNIVGNLVGVGSNPNSLAFDGTNIWSADDYDGSIKLVPASRNQNITATVIPGITGILEVVFDGNNVWGSDGYGVMKFDSQGKVIANPAAGNGANGMVTDGIHLWTANTTGYSVTMLRVADAAVLGTFPVPEKVQIIVFDGKCVWLTETWNYSLTKV
jgi:DNA-binding beta-propeller fold protein YncE